MITIVNISNRETGVNEYELRINRQLITKFKHNRQPGALAQCLRDAADAVDKVRESKKKRSDARTKTRLSNLNSFED